MCIALICSFIYLDLYTKFAQNHMFYKLAKSTYPVIWISKVVVPISMLILLPKIFAKINNLTKFLNSICSIFIPIIVSFALWVILILPIISSVIYFFSVGDIKAILNIAPIYEAAIGPLFSLALWHLGAYNQIKNS